MRVPRVPGWNPRFVFGGALGVAALSLLGGAPVSGSSTWQVGDLVVCVGNGQCRIYPSTGPVTTITVPQNPKKETGEPAWSSAFNVYVVDSRNQKVNLFAKTSPHGVVATIDTAANNATGLPGPLVVDSAGNVYVGMTNLDFILKYDRNGTFQAQIGVPTENGGGVDWMALADDHQTLWYTSGGRELQRLNLVTASTGSVLLPGTGTAAGIRILTVTPSFDPNATPAVDGTNGILVADGANIKLIAGGAHTKTYDVSGTTDEGWRALTLHPDGTTFLAATGDGRIYRFLINGSGAPAGSPLVTGVSGISGLSVKGGAQLNIRPVRFATQAAATNVQSLAVFGNPIATAADAFPRHAFGIRVPSLPAGSDFPVVVSSNWAIGDGECSGLETVPDYDCRAAGFTPLPRCIPYVSGSQSNCVFYRLEDDAMTVPAGLGESLIKFIDFHNPANGYTPAACTGGPKGNPRMLFVEQHGAAFTNDITIGITQTASDPIFGGGTGRTGSDYGAFDRCLEAVDGQLASAFILKPVDGSFAQVNSSVPFEVWITRGGQDVTDAVDDPNDMSLFLYNNTTGASFLEPQETPGGSPDFFAAVTVKLSKNVTRVLYRGNWDSTGKPLGTYTACVSSTDKEADGPGIFAPVCVNFTLKGK